MINMVTQDNQLDSLVLVNKQQFSDDQDNITSLAVPDLPTVSHLHDPDVQHHGQNQGEHVLKVQEVTQHHLAAPLVLDVRVQTLEQPTHRYDVSEDLLKQDETVCNQLIQVCGNNSGDNSVLLCTRKDGQCVMSDKQPPEDD